MSWKFIPCETRFAKRLQLCQVQATTVPQNNASDELLTKEVRVRSPPNH
ncbi:hypothetical protein MKY48_33055 [Paenibacillus sp. FSL W8-0187]